MSENPSYFKLMYEKSRKTQRCHVISHTTLPNAARKPYITYYIHAVCHSVKGIAYVKGLPDFVLFSTLPEGITVCKNCLSRLQN